VAFALGFFISLRTISDDTDLADYTFDIRPIRANLPPSNKKYPDPIRWLKQNSHDKHALPKGAMSNLRNFGDMLKGRPRAALISLVRNSELEGIIQSMKQLEDRWNRKYQVSQSQDSGCGKTCSDKMQYPWIFFNDEPFTDEFKTTTQNLTNATCFYEIVPKEQWVLPEWIDEDRFMNSLEYLGTIGVGKGWLISYLLQTAYLKGLRLVLES
jgi:alpha 1,2-mannosyltransferase